MTDQPISPALTPDGWNAVRDLDLASAGPDMVAMKFRPTAVEANPRHALAALCLHQQRFGFTQEDVTLLEEQAALVRGTTVDPRSEDSIGREAARLATAFLRSRADDFASLASRISALLPPTP